MRRYDVDYRNTYDALRSGRVGEPVLISERHRNPLAVNNFDAQKLIVNTASHGIVAGKARCERTRPSKQT